MSDYLQPQDLIDDKKHSTFFSEVVTGKAGGLAGGANIDTATNAVTSQTQKTMPKIMGDAELAFDAQLNAQQIEHTSQISAHEIEHDNQIAAHEVEHDSQIAAHEVEHDNQIAAHESEFISQLQAQGWNPVAGSFEAGGTIVNRRDILWWEAAKAWYSWQGAIQVGGYAVTAGSTPATAGGVSPTSWVDRTDGALRGELSNHGGMNLVSTGSFAFYLADAPDDGATDATAAFSAAATTADAYGVPLIVKRPTVSYLLNSNPAIPNNLSIDCNLSWFTGAGRLPVHQFVSLSEGVDPRVFDSAEVSYMETSPNEDKRKWAVVGWVNYNNSPLYADTRTDAVGVDGRGLTSVANGRVWGLLGLAQMDTGVSGVAQAIGGEIDVNQNAMNNWEFDGPLPAKGFIVVSGGTKSPETGVMIQATRRPETDQLVDNRFYCGLRFYRSAYTAFGIHFDDTCEGVAIRAPHTTVALRATAGNQYNFDYRMDPTSFRGQLWCPLDKAIDVLYVDGSQIFEFDPTYNRSHKPFVHKSLVTAMGGTINASAADVHVITDNVTITSITGGFDGQEITLINATGANVVVNQGSNMRMSGGTFTMTPSDTLKFICAAPTWFEVSRSSNN